MDSAKFELHVAPAVAKAQRHLEAVRQLVDASLRGPGGRTSALGIPATACAAAVTMVERIAAALRLLDDAHPAAIELLGALANALDVVDGTRRTVESLVVDGPPRSGPARA